MSQHYTRRRSTPATIADALEQLMLDSDDEARELEEFARQERLDDHTPADALPAHKRPF